MSKLDLSVYIDLVATIPPATSIILLYREKVPFLGVRAGSVSRLNASFLVAVIFDTIRQLGYPWAVYGTLASLWAMFSGIGVLAGTFFYCPEARSLPETIKKLRQNPSFNLYYIILTSWVALNVIAPSLYLPITIILLATITLYPTRLFLLAWRRASVTRVKEMLTVLAASWSLFVITAFILFALGTDPPVLGTSLPFAWQMAFLSSSVFLFLMAKAVLDPTGLTRSWTALLVPETMIKIGQRYLVVHDSGAKTQSFLASAFKNLIGGGARIVVRASSNSVLLQDIIENDPHFSRWIKEGKLLGYSSGNNRAAGTREAISGKLGLRPAATVYVTEIEGESLGNNFPQEKKESTNVSELYLLENTHTPRPQLAEFIRRNKEVELLDLSEHSSPFSNLVKLEHAGLRGSTILLEYDSSSSYETLVDKFLSEGISNAELSVLFTSKSSKLYRAIKGKKMVKMVAASSLVSAPDELPDGEVQIPDKELGLVTSIASDLLENNKDMAVSFVFDSITELIRGERWEQVYSGVKQIVELLSVPNVTALFLANRDSSDPHFLGALRSLFSVQMRLGNEGLQIVKLGPA